MVVLLPGIQPEEYQAYRCSKILQHKLCFTKMEGGKGAL